MPACLDPLQLIRAFSSFLVALLTDAAQSAGQRLPAARKRRAAPGPAPVDAHPDQPVVILGIDPDATGAIAVRCMLSTRRRSGSMGPPMHPASTLSLFMYANLPDSSAPFLCMGPKPVRIVHEQVLQWGPATQRKPDGAPANLADCTVDVHDMPMMSVKLGTRNKRCLTVKGCRYLFSSSAADLPPGCAVSRCLMVEGCICVHERICFDRALLIAHAASTSCGHPGRQADAAAIGVLMQTLLPALPLKQAVVSAGLLLLLPPPPPPYITTVHLSHLPSIRLSAVQTSFLKLYDARCRYAFCLSSPSPTRSTANRAGGPQASHTASGMACWQLRASQRRCYSCPHGHLASGPAIRLALACRQHTRG